VYGYGEGDFGQIFIESHHRAPSHETKPQHRHHPCDTFKPPSTSSICNRVFKIIRNGFDDLHLPTVYEKNSHLYQPIHKSILIRNTNLPKQVKNLVDMHKFI